MAAERRPGQQPPPLEPYPSFEQRAYGNTTLEVPPRPHHHLEHPPRRRPPKRRSSWLSSLFVVFLLGLAAVVSGAAVFLLMTPPTNLLRAQLIQQVKAQTGRDLTIAGPTSFTFFPQIGLSMSDVTLSQPPGLQGPAFATMKKLDVAVKLLPLLKRQVAVDRLVLEKPVIHLLVAQNGQTSWDFAALSQQSRDPVRIAQAAGQTSDARGGLPGDAQDFLRGARDESKKPSEQKMAQLSELQLGDVRIIDGTLTYDDAKSGTRERIEAINVELGLDTITKPLTASGDFRWKAEKLDFQSNLTSVADVLQNRPAKLSLSMNGAPIKATYQGTIESGEQFAANGTVNANAASLRKLAAWLGTTLPPAPGFGALAASGQLSVKGPVMALKQSKLQLDGQTATGDITVRTGGIRPAVRAKLAIDQLNLNNYMAGGAAALKPTTNPNTSKPAASKAAQPPKNKANPQSIEDLLKGTGGATRVRGYTARSGWSRDPIDTEVLGLADAEADLSIAKLFVNDLKIDASELAISLKNKLLKTTLKQVALYGGRGTGFVTLDGSAAASAAVGANLSLDGVEALPLLKDAAGQDWLTGRGTIKLAVAGQGPSQEAIMASLNGNAGIQFRDGAIVGINIPGLVRSISQGQLGNLGQGPAEKTDFSEMTSNWTIKSGVASNSDLTLISPLLRVGGEGQVVLAKQTVDYTLRPKLVAKLEGQGGKRDASGLEIPVRVHGPWAKPKFTPELGDILKDPNKALDAVKRIGEQFKGKDANEIIDGLIGGSKNSGSDGTSDGIDSDKAKDLLNRFLR